MAEYSVADDVRALAEQLQQKFAFLSDLSIPAIRFLRSSGGKKLDIKVNGIKPPYTFISNYKFIITVYQNVYDDQYNENQQKIALLKALLKIEDFDEGKTRDYEIKGFMEIEGTYGVLWNREDQDVPDILEDDVQIQTPTIDDQTDSVQTTETTL